MVEREPLAYPNAPAGERRVDVDARNMNVVQALTYGREGEMWKRFEAGSGQRLTDSTRVTAADGRIERSFNGLISHDAKSHRITRVLQAEICRGQWRTMRSADEDRVSNYMIEQALKRMGT